MFKFLLPLCFLASPLMAQETVNLYTVQDCGAPMQMFSIGVAMGEDLLFEGTSTVIGIDGIAYDGVMLFAVNQNTGSWSMYTIYADGTTCLTTFGNDFAPTE